MRYTGANVRYVQVRWRGNFDVNRIVAAKQGSILVNHCGRRWRSMTVIMVLVLVLVMVTLGIMVDTGVEWRRGNDDGRVWRFQSKGRLSTTRRRG